MDIGLIRALVTLAVFVLFIAIVFWAYSKKRRKDFDAASRLPLAEDKPVSEVRDSTTEHSEEKQR